MVYLIILPLLVGVIFALIIGVLRRTRPSSKSDLRKLAVISGGFVALALVASIHLILNDAIG